MPDEQTEFLYLAPSSRHSYGLFTSKRLEIGTWIPLNYASVHLFPMANDGAFFPLMAVMSAAEATGAPIGETFEKLIGKNEAATVAKSNVDGWAKGELAKYVNDNLVRIVEREEKGWELYSSMIVKEEVELDHDEEMWMLEEISAIRIFRALQMTY
ncbi:hypothetical protein HDV00_000181 [Rhizophlyctis rosea]|nr:hypothetical protein HDV00_000181 [Rhizophlyctis rosea]